MAYTINYTNGTIFATIADGTINTSSSMILVGKNYAGYGEFLDENFLHLLENGANATAPGAPVIGQLWWNTTSNVMQVYTGTAWKTISSATASNTAPTNNVTGDLWWDTTNLQLKAYNGSGFTLVGPASSNAQGSTGAVPATITDTLSASHYVVELFSGNTIVGIVSSDPGPWTPSPSISGGGFATIAGPGIQLSSAISGIEFNGTATNSNALGGVSAANFARLNQTSAQSFVGNINVGVNTGNALGVWNIINLNGGVGNTGNIGTYTEPFQFINGRVFQGNTFNGTSSTALYADVAERFAADDAYAPGTVVELGGVAEVTKSNNDLSENVFGVVSTRAAYLMNSGAGNNETHPPIAMTGRVPVLVVGPIRKGDRLVSAGNGRARAARSGEATAFNVIGRALDSFDAHSEGTVEAIVTIK